MTKEEAGQILETIIECLYTNLTEERYQELKEAIEALKAQPKFTRITIDTDERWLNRKFDVFKDRLYLNEKTMIIYVPFVSFELVSKNGGTIKRVGVEE